MRNNNARTIEKAIRCKVDTIIKFQWFGSIDVEAQQDYWDVVRSDHLTVLCNIILFGPPFPRAIRCSDITNHYQLLPVPFPCSVDDYRFPYRSESNRIESRLALRSLINLEFQRYQFCWFSILRLEKLTRSDTALQNRGHFLEIINCRINSFVY